MLTSELSVDGVVAAAVSSSMDLCVYLRLELAQAAAVRNLMESRGHCARKPRTSRHVECALIRLKAQDRKGVVTHVMRKIMQSKQKRGLVYLRSLNTIFVMLPTRKEQEKEGQNNCPALFLFVEFARKRQQVVDFYKIRADAIERQLLVLKK